MVLNKITKYTLSDLVRISFLPNELPLKLQVLSRYLLTTSLC